MRGNRLLGRRLLTEPDGPWGGPRNRTQARREGGLFVWAEYVVLVRVGEEESAEVRRLLDHAGATPGAPGGSVEAFDLLTALGVANEPRLKLQGPPAERLSEMWTSEVAACRVRLTEREVDVLKLIACGRTNRQIADELVISLNTVARHVSNIFDKTGAANRAEAAVYAARRDLL